MDVAPELLRLNWPASTSPAYHDRSGIAERVRIELFFDVVCPFAYLASTRIVAIANEAGAELVWRPVLLGGVLVSQGVDPNPMGAMPASKLRLTRLDMV